MAYDEDLADRIRELVGGEPGLEEKTMFGGLAFLVGGHMAVAASGQGGLLVRVDPAEGEGLVGLGGAEPMVMRGRAMDGWLRVDPEQQAALTAGSDSHVAVEQEGQPTEHLLLGHARHVLDRGADPGGQDLVVSHPFTLPPAADIDHPARCLPG